MWILYNYPQPSIQLKTILTFKGESLPTQVKVSIPTKKENGDDEEHKWRNDDMTRITGMLTTTLTTKRASGLLWDIHVTKVTLMVTTTIGIKLGLWVCLGLQPLELFKKRKGDILIAKLRIYHLFGFPAGFYYYFFPTQLRGSLGLWNVNILHLNLQDFVGFFYLIIQVMRTLCNF